MTPSWMTIVHQQPHLCLAPSPALTGSSPAHQHLPPCTAGVASILFVKLIYKGDNLCADLFREKRERARLPPLIKCSCRSDRLQYIVSPTLSLILVIEARTLHHCYGSCRSSDENEWQTSFAPGSHTPEAPLSPLNTGPDSPSHGAQMIKWMSSSWWLSMA